MSKDHNHKEAFHKLCDDLSDDINGELCDEVKEHLKECPECRVYVDTLRQTVYLYRGESQIKQEAGVPKDVSDRLFKVLNLDEIREEMSQNKGE